MNPTVLMARQHGSQTSIALLSKWEIWPFKPPLRRGFVYATDYILRNIFLKMILCDHFNPLRHSSFVFESTPSHTTLGFFFSADLLDKGKSDRIEEGRKKEGQQD